MDDYATIRAEPTAQTEPERASSLTLRKGTVVGRYVALHEVGRGAMGAVWAAYDPRLDRRVAIKLLLDRSDRAEALERLLREAQSLARLNHPNVVSVHDVDEFDDRVFVAMEFVEGRTLRQWQREQTRPWRIVLDTYRQAAMGLAAAHAAGVIHRDFKPENVMIADDGRVKVMDFGLARSGVRPSGPASGAGSLDDDGGQATLTDAGTLLGTPAYMSPEQFAQRAVGPASDQFGFCVAFFEALVGQRPFDGSTLHELATSVAAGRIRDTPPTTAPGWLLQIVRKGLAPAPEDRHASMDALLAALDRGLRRRRRPLLLVAGAAAGVGLALVATLREGDDASCRRAAAELRDIWSPQRHAEIESALVSTGHASAHDSWRRASARIDAFASAWIEQHDHVCGAWRQSLSDSLLTLRRDCLLVQRSHLEGLLDAFADPTAATIGFAVAATAGLPAPDECAQIDSVEDAPPADWAEEVTAAQQLAARAQARRVAGDPGGAAEIYAEALGVLGDIPAPRARARILTARGDLLAFQGAIARAEDDYDEARRLAAQSGDTEQLAKLWLDRIVHLNFHHPDELDRQEHLLEAAELAVLADGQRPAHVARLLVARGLVAMDRGDFEAAQARLEEGIAAAAGADVSAASIASYHDLLGNVAISRGDYAEARAQMSRALEIIVDAYGEAYPSVRTFHANVGGACLMMGDRACAREHFEAVRSLLDAAGDDLSIARGHNFAQLAELERGAGNAELAGEYAEAALTVWRGLGLDSTLEAATTKAILHHLAVHDDRLDDALALAQEVDRIYRTQRPPEHPDHVLGLKYISDILHRKGRHDEALTALDSVIATREAALGPDHELIGNARGDKAQILEVLGRHAEGLAEARRAHDIFVKAGSRLELRAAGAFVHARLLWHVGDHARALDLARDAIRDFDEAGAEATDDRREAAVWLRERGADPALP
jgi:tetratricopeptide (TPR) repeat protein